MLGYEARSEWGCASLWILLVCTVCAIRVASNMQHPRYFENNLDDTTTAEEVSTAQKEYVPELLQIIHKNCPPVVENCEGAMYVGAAGIGYAFYHVAECPVFADKRNHFLEIAESYVKVSYFCLK